jgi:aminomethyltransferase
MQKALSRTPLYKAHLAMGARMVPFAGYEMPVQYKGVIEETKGCRSTVGLFDVSHMGQFSLKGSDLITHLQKLVTNDLSKLALHQAQYSLLCNEKGGVIDDLIIYRRSEKELYICVNASNRQVDFEWMREHLPSQISLTDQSDQTGLIAVQGPQAEALMSQLAPPVLVTQLKYYWAIDTEIAGIPLLLSRTGYTGEDGFELYVKSENTEALWNLLLEKGKQYGIVPCGLGARDTLRLEMGYPLHGHELSTEISPLQAGLNWVVKLETTASFIGKDSLLREQALGPSPILKAFTVQDRRIARQGYELVTESQQTVGHISSGTFSPHLNAPIALGFVTQPSLASEKFFVKIRNDLVPAKLSSLPFVPSRVKRNLPLRQS